MKRVHLFLLLLVFINSIHAMGQKNVERDYQPNVIDCLRQCGKDDCPLLNDNESIVLNYILHGGWGIFEAEGRDFDFTGKRVAFFKGNVGSVPSTKKEFFCTEKRYAETNGCVVSGFRQLVVFDEKEINRVGYDAMIITSSKKLLSKREAYKLLVRHKNK